MAVYASDKVERHHWNGEMYLDYAKRECVMPSENDVIKSEKLLEEAIRFHRPFNNVNKYFKTKTAAKVACQQHFSKQLN